MVLLKIRDSHRPQGGKVSPTAGVALRSMGPADLREREPGRLQARRDGTRAGRGAEGKVPTGRGRRGRGFDGGHPLRHQPVDQKDRPSIIQVQDARVFAAQRVRMRRWVWRSLQGVAGPGGWARWCRRRLQRCCPGADAVVVLAVRRGRRQR